MERKSIFTVDPASPLEDADKFFVGQIREDLPSTNAMTVADLKNQIGGKLNIVDYNPGDNIVVSPIAITVESAGATWDGSRLALTGTPDYTIPGDTSTIPYIAISLTTPSSGGITIDTSTLTKNVFMLLSVPNGVTVGEWLGSIVSGSAIEFPYSAIILGTSTDDMAQAVGVANVRTISDPDTAPLQQSSQDVVYDTTAPLTIRYTNFYDYLVEMGYANNNATEESIATAKAIPMLVTSGKSTSGDVNTLMATPSDVTTTKTFLVFLGDFLTGATNPLEFDPINPELDLSELREISYNLPNESKDGDVLRITAPVTLLGHTLFTGDFFQIYGAKTNGIITRQDAYFNNLTSNAEVTLTPDSVVPMVFRGTCELADVQSFTANIIKPVVGNYIIVNKSYNEYYIYYWQGSGQGWNRHRSSSFKGVFQDYNDVVALTECYPGDITLVLNQGKSNLCIYFNSNWVFITSPRTTDDIEESETHKYLTRTNLWEFVSSYINPDDSDNDLQLVTAGQVKTYLELKVPKPTSILYSYWINQANNDYSNDGYAHEMRGLKDSRDGDLVIPLQDRGKSRLGCFFHKSPLNRYSKKLTLAIDFRANFGYNDAAGSYFYVLTTNQVITDATQVIQDGYGLKFYGDVNGGTVVEYGQLSSGVWNVINTLSGQGVHGYTLIQLGLDELSQPYLGIDNIKMYDINDMRFLPNLYVNAYSPIQFGITYQVNSLYCEYSL